MISSNKKAFTLVEIIVVIAILAILWTIGFLSFSWYISQSRDAKRTSDIDNLNSSIELSLLDNSSYPIPDNPISVTYSWAVVWIQWTIWEWVISHLKDFSKVPLDPLYNNEYTYSVLNWSDEFQIWTILEWNLLSNNSSDLLNKSYWANSKYYAYVKWNYNWIVAMVRVWSIYYFFAIPSILSSDLSESDLQKIIEKKAFVFNWYKNIPYNYKWNNIEMTWSFDFGWEWVTTLISTWNINELSTNWDLLNNFWINLKNIYTWTDLEDNLKYKDIIDMSTQEEILNIVWNILNDNLWWLVSFDSSCIFEPPYKNAIFTNWTPLFNNTPWQNTNSWAACYYSCVPWYTWHECNDLAYSCATQPSYTHALFIPWVPLSDNSAWQQTDWWSACYFHCTDWFEWLACETDTTNSCLSQPNYSHAIFTYWTPTAPNTAWQKTTSWQPCYYTCATWYSWTDCSHRDEIHSCATQPTHTHATYTVWSPTQENTPRQTSYSNHPCYYHCNTWYTWYDCHEEHHDD